MKIRNYFRYRQTGNSLFIYNWKMYCIFSFICTFHFLNTEITGGEEYTFCCSAERYLGPNIESYGISDFYFYFWFLGVGCGETESTWYAGH
jgi:hypothetical protein